MAAKIVYVTRREFLETVKELKKLIRETPKKSKFPVTKTVARKAAKVVTKRRTMKSAPVL